MMVPRPLLAGLVSLLALVGCDRSPGYPHASEPIGSVRAVYDGALSPELAITTFRNTDRLFATRVVPRATVAQPLPPAERSLPPIRFADQDGTYDLEQYLELNRVTGLLVLHQGRIALERYRFGNTEATRWMSMSIAKSITSTLVGMALRDGSIGSLADPVTRYVPELTGSGYDGVAIRDVLRMASGVQWDETYTDPTSDRRRFLEAQLSQQPGAVLGVMAGLPRRAEPGIVYNYSTGEVQLAAEVLRRAVGVPLSTYLAERIWSRIGTEADAFWWLDSPDGTEIGGSGFSATLRDYGRFGLFLLNGGVVEGDSLLPAGWIEEATTAKTLADGTAVDYGYLWWTATTPEELRDGAYVAEGLYGQFIYVNPAARVVIVVWSARDQPTGSDRVSDWAFFQAVADSLR